MNWFENPWDIGAPPPSGAKPTTSAPPNNTQLDTTQNSAATPSPEAEGSAGGESVNLGSMLMVLELMQENAARIKELRQNRETALLQNAELLQTQLQRNYDLLQQQHSQQLDMMDMQMKLQQAQPVDWSVNRWDISTPEKQSNPIQNQKEMGYYNSCPYNDLFGLINPYKAYKEHVEEEYAIAKEAYVTKKMLEKKSTSSTDFKNLVNDFNKRKDMDNPDKIFAAKLSVEVEKCQDAKFIIYLNRVENAIVTLQKNDPALFNYLNNLSVLTETGNPPQMKETRIKVFVYDKESAKLPNNATNSYGYTNHLDYKEYEQIGDKVQVKGVNPKLKKGSHKGKTIQMPMVNCRYPFPKPDEQKIDLSIVYNESISYPGCEVMLNMGYEGEKKKDYDGRPPGDEILANEIGDVMFNFEFNDKSVKEEIEDRTGNISATYGNSESNYYSQNVEDNYKRKKAKDNTAYPNYPLPEKYLSKRP